MKTQADRDRKDAERYRKIRDGEEELPPEFYQALEDGGDYLDAVVDNMPDPPR